VEIIILSLSSIGVMLLTGNGIVKICSVDCGYSASNYCRGKGTDREVEL